MDSEPRIFEEPSNEQFDRLIFQPLSELKKTSTTVLKYIIVIDALDECGDEGDTRTIIHLLSQIGNPEFIRVILTSRPELRIQFGFKDIGEGRFINFVLTGIEEHIIERDIEIFFRHELAAIKRRFEQYFHPDRHLTIDWPGEKSTQELVKMATPLFIIAATICRMLRNTGCDPEEKLIRILESHTRISGASEIERTYITVLDQLLVDLSDWEQKDMIDEFQKIIGTIINLATPLSTASLANLLGIPKKKVDSRLDFFHSVLSVPEDPKEPVRLLHLSFRDFLVGSHFKQHGDGSLFWVDEIECHKTIATACLKRLFDTLRKDICGLEDFGGLRATIIQEDIDNNLQPDVQYACCYWVHHMKLGKTSVDDGDQVHDFLKIHFLHWLEALSILGKSYDIILLIRDLTSLIDSSSTEALEFIRDAHRFALMNRAIIDSAPLQLYSSALIFTPRKSIIRRIFIDQVPDYIQTLPTVEDEWDAVLQILHHEHPGRGHGLAVEAVAFSPDGELLVSGSRDKTVRVWDSVTGALKLKLEGHESDIKAVSFSPDGSLIFSIASDALMQWDSKTGARCGVLKGSFTLGSPMIFSPDGQLLVSVPDKYQAWIWNFGLGSHCIPLATAELSHGSDYPLVCLSQDGEMIAIGRRYGYMEVVSTATGALLQTLKPPNKVGRTCAMSFLPDSQLVALALPDVSDQSLGSSSEWLELEPDHDICLESSLYYKKNRFVRISRDGKRVAATTGDIVKVWDSDTGLSLETITGQWGEIWDILFAPDGSLVVIGPDTTIKVLESATGKSRLNMQIDTGFAFSWKWDKAEAKAAISPSNTLLAIAEPHSLYIYNLVSGVQQLVCNGFSDIGALTFSPDSGIIATTMKSTKRKSTSELLMHNGVKLYDSATGDFLHSVAQLEKSPSKSSERQVAIAFTPAGDLIAMVSNSGSITLLDPKRVPRQSELSESWIQGHTFGAVIAYQYENYEGGYFGAISDCKTKMELVSFLDCNKEKILESTLPSDDDYMLKFSPDSKLLAAKINGCLQVWDILGLIDRTARDLRPTYMDDKNTETIVSFPDDLQLARPPKKLTSGGRAVRGLGRVSKPSNANSQLTSSLPVLKCSLKPKAGPRGDQLRQSNRTLGAKNAQINRDVKRATDTRLSNNNSLGSKQANSIPDKSVPIDKTSQHLIRASNDTRRTANRFKETDKKHQNSSVFPGW
ncbi:hypothetical protein TWF970_001725 [Orbilia oligospora]|uniref:Mitochondrial division protein 1 n=1 Tax=Orbilia oligospora TaxID=2813651 RepID=A0A7C8VS32_ORBOL|nr:hypothetical protein TWF970_001725 [Orbilia oligospora]